MSWEQVKLGDIFEIARGGSPRPIDQYITDDPNGLNWISIKDASNSSKYIYKTEKKIKPEGLHKTRLVHPDDFLLTNSMSFGRPYIMKTTGCIHDGWLVLSADKSRVDTEYFYHLLGSDFMYRKFAGLAAGAVVKNLNTELVKSVSVPLPPLAEQRRIASILDQADELRQKRQQAIEKLDQLLQATFIDMFGDPVSNPKGWNLGKLGDVIHSAKDGPHVSPSYSETGIPFLSTRHVRAGKIVWGDLKFITEEDAQIHWKKCKPTRGDILYTKGGTTGLAAVVDTDLDFAVWVHVALLKTNHDKVRTEWLVSMLNTQYCYEQSQRYTHGIANRDLGLKRMVNIEMYIPSLDEQDKFVNFKNKLMKNNLLFENSNSYFEQLFKSLQNQAFNGTL